jgi:hypothetical protein
VKTMRTAEDFDQFYTKIDPWDSTQHDFAIERSGGQSQNMSEGARSWNWDAEKVI